LTLYQTNKIKLPYKDEQGKPYYMDLLGHFFEPWKAVTETERWVTGKGSFLWRQLLDQATGENWRGNKIGDLTDLAEGIHAVASFTPIPVSVMVDVLRGEKDPIQLMSTTGIPVTKGRKRARSSFR
jgi:hypothetical protein